MVSLTARLGTFRRAKLRSGETICVRGGSGGGSCVVQMAHAAGSRVIATAGSDKKAERCRQFGADCVVNYKSDDLAAAIGQFAPNGVDVWFETLRQQDFDLILGHMAVGGRIDVMAGRDAAAPRGKHAPWCRDTRRQDCALGRVTGARGTVDGLFAQAALGLGPASHQSRLD